ncbi:MAG: ADP-ribose pyrophosphatase [Tenericutes bacterium HGW-Tenericutes-6]|jgi:ADP-ribose pyrophosphatase|nr:MAG: ADP-ribose pyrophosphatase [Tenericutes bacterium HGW-Tenericutes-6]
MIEKRLKRQHKYTCSFLDLYEDDVLVNGLEKKRVVIKHPGGAAVLPITKEGTILLTKQYRYPIEKVSIEIPAGKKDRLEEDALTCAKRELEEETGYQSNHFEHLYDLHPCLGYSDELLIIYIAYDCEKVLNPRTQDDDESIEVMEIKIDEIENLLKSGIITDGKTLIALQYILWTKGVMHHEENKT